MKKIGVIIIVIGAVITTFITLHITFSSQENIVDAGNFQVNMRKQHSLPWSPFVGIAIMVVGGGTYMLGSKRSLMR